MGKDSTCNFGIEMFEKVSLGHFEMSIFGDCFLVKVISFICVLGGLGFKVHHAMI